MAVAVYQAVPAGVPAGSAARQSSQRRRTAAAAEDEEDYQSHIPSIYPAIGPSVGRSDEFIVESFGWIGREFAPLFPHLTWAKASMHQSTNESGCQGDACDICDFNVCDA